MTSLGTLELQLTANQAALYQQLNQTKAYATQVAKDIEKQINQAFGSVGGNKLGGLNQATAQAASAGQAAGRTFTDRFKNAVEPIKGILSNVFNGVFVGAGIGAFNSITGVVGSALGAVQQFAGEIFNVTKDFQNFESSLKTFLRGNQKEIDDFVSKLEKFAVTTPFELKELQQGAIQNLATGAKPDQIIKDLKTIGDVAAGANARLGDLMDVYAKSRTEGKLQNEDIDQFTGRGVQLRGELAKMLGAKESEIRQLATDGKLEFRHLEEALRRMSAEGGAYFGAMENKAKTLEGRLSNVQDTFYQFQKSIGVAFEPIMNFIVQTFGDVIAGLTSSNSIMKDVRKESEKLVATFKANPQLVQSLNKAIQELVAGGFKLLLDGITSFTKYLETNPNIIKDMSTAFNDFWGVVKGVFDGLKFIFDGINFVVGVIQAGARGAADIWVASEPTLNNIWQKTVDISKAIADGIVAAWNTCVNLVKSLIKLIQSLFNGVVNLTTNGINLLNAGLKTAVSITQAIGENIGKWTSNIGSAIQKAGEFASQGIPGIGSAFQLATKKAEEFWKWATGQNQQPTTQLQASSPNSGNGNNMIGNIVQGVQGFLGLGSSGSTINQPKYKIVESVGRRTEKVTQYSDLEPHHPSIVKRGGHKDRPYGIVEGRKEELNPLNRNLIKKDFVLIDPQGKQFGVPVPSPVTGYAGQVGQGWGAVNLYADKEMTKLIAQVGHMNNLLVKNGQLVQYGQTLGGQAGMGKKGVNTYGTHVDMSADPETYRRYIRDLQAGMFKGAGQNLFQQGFSAVKQFFTPVQNALPTGAGLSSRTANVVRGKNEGIFGKAGLTDSLVALVKKSEGFAATPYSDRTQYSVGFGTKAKSTGERLTVEEANQRLLNELLYKRSRVQKMVKVPINNNQLDALTSFAFNVGEGALGESTLLKKLNSGDYAGAAKEFLRWNKGKYRGVTQALPGLTKRRNSEMQLFLSQSNTTPAQQAVTGKQKTGNGELAQTPGVAQGGNAEDQRNLLAARRKLAETKYREIKDEIDAATKQTDNAQKQQRELDARKRDQLDKEKRANFAAYEALAPDDEAKKIIQKSAKRYEIDNRYQENLIKFYQEREDLLDARTKKLEILAKAKKRGETVTPDDAGVDYSKAINQLDEIIKSEKQLRVLELETNNLNQSSAEKEIEKNKDRQREIEKLSRVHEAYINQLRLQQSLVGDDATKQGIQSTIDKAQIEYSAKTALMPLQNQLYDLQDRKVYLLGEGGLKEDSEEVKRLQKDINNLVAQIHSIANKGGVDLKLFENQRKQIELQNQRLRESEKQEIEHSKQVLELNKEISTAQTQQQKAELQFQLDKINAIQQEKQVLTTLKQEYDDLTQGREKLINEGKLDAASDVIKVLDGKIAGLNEKIKILGEQSKSSFEILTREGQKTIEQGRFADLESALSKEASMLPAQTGSIRRRGGNEYEVSALEAEAARMEEQFRYKQELLQIEQQIAAAKGKANEYTEQEIAALQANAEAINKINLEGISQQVKTLGKDLLDVGKNALGSFFGDIISGSKSAGDAFKDLIGSIAQQLTQLAVNSLISNIFGGGGGLFGGGGGKGGGILGFSEGYVPNYATGNSNPISEALNRERVQSGGRKAILGVFNEDEMILTAEQSKRFQELRLDKVLNFANGGIVGGGQNLSNEIGSRNMNINIPVTVEGGGDGSVNVPQLQSSLRSVVLAEIQKQQRPGGALNR
jgi:GH24 family phage-related lysozyme (muramidase)